MKKTFDSSLIAKFFAETAMGKTVKRSGFSLLGISQTESLGEHIYRTAQIAYVLAYFEGANPEKAAAIALFHDNGEFRIGDQNKISARYINKKKAELEALTEQLTNLPVELRARISSLFSHFEERDTLEGIVARDADLIETALSAKAHVEQGYASAQNWIDNVSKALETQSAKEILNHINTQENFVNSWWQGLKKMTFEKLEK
jgi:putative hydrolase of HD superfamily